MRKYRTAFEGEVDLDNPETYDFISNDIDILDDEMFRLIGQAICYMNYFHPEIYQDENNNQRFRVNKLIAVFCNNREKNYENLMWYKEQVFLFADETENMC
jgi:hypothetical protein